MTETAETFEAERGIAPTAGVWVVMDEEGYWRVGWDTRESDMKAGMAIAYAMQALIQHLGKG